MRSHSYLCNSFCSLHPLRIVHHPNLVLKVCVAGNVEGDSSALSSGLVDAPGSPSGLIESASYNGGGLDDGLLFVEDSSDDMEVIDIASDNPGPIKVDQDLHTEAQTHASVRSEIVHSQNVSQERQQMDQLTSQWQQSLYGEHHQQNMSTLSPSPQQQLTTRPKSVDPTIVLSRIQTLLSTSFRYLPIPRLFVILPKAIGRGGELEKASPPQFQLYYLCECGAHTTGKDSQRTHEMHMVKGSGYDIVNHQEFFDKYGSYLLTMMYMVKYGAAASGRVIPPLSNLQRDSWIVAGFEPLVDETITHLENTLCAIDDHSDLALRSELDSSEMALLTSYLKIDGEGAAFGNLCPTITQDQRCVWICKEHQHVYHESTMKQLEDMVNANEGEYVEEQGEITIKLRSQGSQVLEECFYNAFRKLRWIRDFNNQLSLTPFRLKVDNSDTTSHLLINTSSINSLIMDFQSFRLKAGLSQNGSQYLDVELRYLSGLTKQDLNFISRCNYKRLSISKSIGEEEDENRLVNILQDSRRLEVLRVGTLSKHSRGIINLIISTREKALQSNHPILLHTVEVMDEDFVPLATRESYDEDDHIETTVLFPKGCYLPDIKTRLVLRKGMVTKANPLCDFIRHYGWSIESLDGPGSFSDHLATLLYDSIRERGSKITRLFVTPTTLTTPGLEALDQVIKASPSLNYLRLSFADMQKLPQMVKAMVLLERYKEKLDDIELRGNLISNWLPEMVCAFPRSSFPKLKRFVLKSSCGNYLCPESVKWFVSMISAPPHLSHPSRAGSSMARPQSRLHAVTLSGVRVLPEDWVSVVEAVDLSILNMLDFRDTNFSHKDVELLVNRTIGRSMPQVGQVLICLRKQLFENYNVRALRARLGLKLPQVRLVHS